MKIIAVDDEILQLETLMEYISEFYPDSEVKGFSRVSEVVDYIENESVDVAVLDISMPGNINGIQLGEIIREKNPAAKILYCSGYSDYALDAFKIHANGYLQKPVMKEDFKKEMAYLLNLPEAEADEKPYIHTFGNFDIFVNGRPVVFKRRKSKEILAYAIDREGSWVSNREIAAVLWDEDGVDIALTKYITTIVKDLIDTLEEVGAGNIFERERGKLRILKDEVNCDYYNYLKGDKKVLLGFHSEYMSQYSWGEETLASILENIKKNSVFVDSL